MTQAIYIGAGFDTDAVFALPHIQRFVYSDGLPLTDYPTASFPDGSWFIPRLKIEFMEKGFILKQETSCKLVFTNSAGQVIDYYHSQPFPRISKELEQEIRESDYSNPCTIIEFSMMEDYYRYYFKHLAQSCGHEYHSIDFDVPNIFKKSFEIKEHQIEQLIYLVNKTLG